MRRSYIWWVFNAACVGLVVSLIIRERYDGVAFLFTIIAAGTFVLGLYFKEIDYFEGLELVEADVMAEREKEDLSA